MTEANAPSPDSRAFQLMRAHIAHELALFEEDELKAVLETELPAAYEWLQGQTVAELAPRQEVQAFVRRALVQARPEPEAREFGLKVSRALLASLKDVKQTGKDVLSREGFDRLVEKIGGDEKLRRAGVHLMVNNAVFAMVVSETLYHGIGDFMTQSKLTQTIPGAQSLFKLGQDMLSQAVPGLKDNFEKTIKDFIKNNAGNIIKNSEEFLNRSLGPETIKEAADQLWEDLAGRPLSEIPEFISGEDLAEHADILQAFAERFRRTEVFADLFEKAFDVYYESYGDRPMRETLKMLGVTGEMFAAEATGPLLNLARVARESGYLEQVIERRLRSFYGSSRAAKLLD